jgi:hypothetical protein
MGQPVEKSLVAAAWGNRVAKTFQRVEKASMEGRYGA